MENGGRSRVSRANMKLRGAAYFSSASSATLSSAGIRRGTGESAGRAATISIAVSSRDARTWSRRLGRNYGGARDDFSRGERRNGTLPDGNFPEGLRGWRRRGMRLRSIGRDRREQLDKNAARNESREPQYPSRSVDGVAGRNSGSRLRIPIGPRDGTRKLRAIAGRQGLGQGIVVAERGH